MSDDKNCNILKKELNEKTVMLCNSPCDKP